MNIGELIESTNAMGKNRTLSDCLGKKFGTIYAGNKEVVYKSRAKDSNCLVEVSMYIGAKTQEDRSLHKVSIALKGLPAEKCDLHYLSKWIKDNVSLDVLLASDMSRQVLRNAVTNTLASEDSAREILRSQGKEVTDDAIRILHAKINNAYKGWRDTVGVEDEKFSTFVPYYSLFQKARDSYNSYGKRESFKDNKGVFNEKAYHAFQSRVITGYKEEFSEDYAKLVKEHELRERNEYLSGYKKARQMNKRYNSLSSYNKTFVDQYSIIDESYNVNANALDINNYTTVNSRRFMTPEEVAEYANRISGEDSAKSDILEYVKQGYYMDKKGQQDIGALIPDEYIKDLVTYNPYIVLGHVIIQDDNSDGYVIIKNKVDMNTECQVYCSCFTGDTRVQLANGMSLSLKDLENMTDFKVLAYNTETGKYEYARALNCTKRQENARIIKITLADGTSIRVTPSHRFLNNKCEWKQAQEFQVGDLLKFNERYWGYENHEQKTSSSTFVYLDPTQEGEYEFGELKFTHRPFYVGVTTGAFVKIENEKCIEYLNKLADMNEQPLMFKQYYHVDEHVALQLKEKLVNRIGTIEQGSLLVNNPVQVNDNFINENDDCIAIVEIVELQEREDVYCLTVEGLGNFAIQTNNKGNIIVENCADYEYTYAWYNFENKAHIFTRTRPLRYYTDTLGAIPEVKRNPNHLPGMCKHLVVLLSILLEEGIISTRDQSIMRKASTFMVNKGKVLEYRNIDIRDSIDKLENELKKYRKGARNQVKQERYETKRSEGYRDYLHSEYDIDSEEKRTVHVSEENRDLEKMATLSVKSYGKNIVKTLLGDYNEITRKGKIFGRETFTPRAIKRGRNKW